MIQNLIGIFGKKHLRVGTRLRLAIAYVQLRLKRLFLKHIPFLNHTKTSFLGFVIHHEVFDDFFWTFCDVFLEEGYYVHTTDKEPTFIDCGGNIGVTTLYFLFLYPKAHITVFEPEVRNLEYLRKNIKENNLEDRVTLIEKAVSDTEGTITLYGVGRAVTTSKALHDAEVAEKDTYNNMDESTAEMVKLSAYITSPVTCVKLDIEGAEQSVMSELAASGTLDRIQSIVIEYHQHTDTDRASDIFRIFEDHGFVYQTDYGSHTLSGMARTHYYHYMINAQKKHG